MENHDTNTNGTDDINADEAEERAIVRQRSGSVMRKEFAGQSLAVGNSATDALVAKARADVEARWIMAMRMPRNLDDVRVNIMAECKSPEFAKAAVYARPVGAGQVAEGLSIRFAEMAMRQMGNASAETMTIFDDDNIRIVRVTVTDFETNATWSKDLNIRKTVERKQLKKGQRPLGERVNSYGDRVYIVEATDDDVAIKEASAVSKASRTGILRLVPGHIQREALASCKKTIKDKAAKDPEGERCKILDAFALLRVLPSDLEEYLGHPTAQLVPVEIERLRSIYQAIADGESSWREILDAVNEARAGAKPANPPPAAQGAAATTATAPATSAATKPATKRSGAAGLKEQLKGEGKPAEPAPAPAKEPTSFDRATSAARAKDAQREAEPGWMAGETRGATPTGGEPVDDAPVPDFEERACAGCGAAIECPKGEPAGAKCYACRSK